MNMQNADGSGSQFLFEFKIRVQAVENIHSGFVNNFFELKLYNSLFRRTICTFFISEEIFGAV
jgi:hypothetical protein